MVNMAKDDSDGLANGHGRLATSKRFSLYPRNKP